MFTVEEESEGYRVYSDGWWGIGYTFQNRECAEAAAEALNDCVAVDQDREPATQR